MRVGIQGWGSEGDLRPLIALAARLHRHSHDVRLILSPVDGMNYRPLCARLEVPLQVVPERMPHTLRDICQASRNPDPTKVSRTLIDLAFMPHLEAMYEAALTLSATSDVMVGLFSSWYVKASCLATRTPFVSVHYYPRIIPSRELPPPVGFPAWRWLNPISWYLFGKLINLGFKGDTAKFFASRSLPRVRNALQDLLLSDRLNLVACSPSLFTAPGDWDSQTRLCGDFIVPDDAPSWQMSPSLQQFIADGDKPVFVSFGTMAQLAPERSRELVTQATRKAGVRAIFQSKCGSEQEGRDGDLYLLRWAPHDQLLPLCRAMVLHGGAGTIHAALRGGTPAVVVPFIFEQGLWGDLLYRVGSATKPLKFWKANAETLANRIEEAIRSEKMQQRAADLARVVAHEDGTGTAASLIRELKR